MKTQFYKDEDRRVEDYEYNEKTSETKSCGAISGNSFGISAGDEGWYEFNSGKIRYIKSEQGEKMNDTAETGRKQVSQQAVELKLSIDCLSARMQVLEEALGKVLIHKTENDTNGYPKPELCPLADFLATEKDRITFVNCWIEDILNRLEL